MKTTFAFLRFAVTTVAVVAAFLVGGYLWIYYMDEPWTRDGRAIGRHRTLKQPAALIGLSCTSRLCAPHAKARGLETELAWPMGSLVLDFIHAYRIFEHHSIRALKVEESCARCRMTTWAEHNRHSLAR